MDFIREYSTFGSDQVIVVFKFLSAETAFGNVTVIVYGVLDSIFFLGFLQITYFILHIPLLNLPVRIGVVVYRAVLLLEIF